MACVRSYMYREGCLGLQQWYSTPTPVGNFIMNMSPHCANCSVAETEKPVYHYFVSCAFVYTLVHKHLAISSMNCRNRPLTCALGTPLTGAVE